MVTVASGITAPEPSVTAPVIVPAAVWAWRGSGGERSRKGKKAKAKRLENECIHQPPGHLYGCLLKSLLRKSNRDRRGSGVERKVGEPVCKCRLQIDDWRRRLPRCQGNRRRRCGSNHYVGSRTKSASRVGYAGQPYERARFESSLRTPATEHSKEQWPAARDVVRALCLAYRALL